MSGEPYLQDLESDNTMQDTFNFNFYLATAAVLPLLYITLVLQGPVFDDFERMAKRLREYRLRIMRIHPVRYYVAAFLSTIWFYFVVIVIAAGIIGEAVSLWALYYESDTIIIRKAVLWSTLGLLGLLTIRPVVGIYKATIRGRDEAEQASENPDLSTEKMSGTPSAEANGGSPSSSSS